MSVACLPNMKIAIFGLAMRTLFRFSVTKGCPVHRIKAESSDKDLAASCCAELLPDCIDLLLWGVGEGGHIASLFPGGAALHETRKVVAITGPKSPVERITITPLVIT